MFLGRSGSFRLSNFTTVTTFKPALKKMSALPVIQIKPPHIRGTAPLHAFG